MEEDYLNMNNTLDESDSGGEEESDVEAVMKEKTRASDREQALRKIAEEQEAILRTIKRYPGVYERSATPPRRSNKETIQKYPNVYARTATPPRTKATIEEEFGEEGIGRKEEIDQELLNILIKELQEEEHKVKKKETYLEIYYRQ